MPRLRTPAALALLAGVAVFGLGAGLTANHFEAKGRLEKRAQALTGGDPVTGRAAIEQRPCGGCHQIPGVRGASGKVGPPLAAFAQRTYIGGRVNNAPENLILWLQDPHAIDPQSAMPPMGIGPREARDIAAYLYTLK
ncbi:c-type cytochrome [Phenylobacterium deserti]|uniref:Cytochrome C n=1 Tax=Phenylobacterium deserti TaxID=1914756 RepID=A0A328APJ4_9CAUL|nr:c-type cytochrome [Phenylobacterium deserti]RAK56922.1 cytochrome C [Phenylobacterium deserti]